MGVKRGRGRGLFITFEGIEGSGKTTQLAGAAKLLREEGYRVLETREPGGTLFAERIRELLLGHPADSPSAEPIAPECETSLILASRSQHVARVIMPALREGTVVLCDRFWDPTLAYQGYGRGLGLDVRSDLPRFATPGLTPAPTLPFALPVPVALARRPATELDQHRLHRAP